MSDTHKRLTFVMRNADDEEIIVYEYHPREEVIEEVQQYSSKGLYVAEVRLDTITSTSRQTIWKR